MSFNPNIPQSSNIPSQSQAQFLTNFGQLNTIFDVDHVTYDNATSANRGKHDKSTYVELGSAPATLTNEVAVYAKDTGTQPDLFYRPEGSGTEQRLTGGGITAAAWVYYNGSAISSSYNVTSVVYGGGGGFTVNFTRSFASSSFAAIITLDIDGTGTNATGVLITSRTTSSIAWTSRGQDGSVFQFPFSAVFFGTLA